MREHERLAGGQVRLDVFLIAFGLLGVGQGDHDDIGLLDALSGRDDFEALFLRDGNGLAALVKADDDLEAAVLEVKRVGVALRAEAKDRQCFVFEHAEIGVFVGIDFGHKIR